LQKNFHPWTDQGRRSETRQEFHALVLLRYRRKRPKVTAAPPISLMKFPPPHFPP